QLSEHQSVSCLQVLQRWYHHLLLRFEDAGKFQLAHHFDRASAHHQIDARSRYPPWFRPWDHQAQVGERLQHHSMLPPESPEWSDRAEVALQEYCSHLNV